MREVLSKVALGQVDAGFVYSTDAQTVPGQVTVIKVPAWAQPKVTYAMAVVTNSPNQAAAQAFINEVLSKAGQAKLLSFGFLPLVKPKEKIATKPPEAKKKPAKSGRQRPVGCGGAPAAGRARVLRRVRRRAELSRAAAGGAVHPPSAGHAASTSSRTRWSPTRWS